MALIIGVDPGKAGGIVQLNIHGLPQNAWSMPQVLGPRGGKTGKINWPEVRRTMDNQKGIVALEDLAAVTAGMSGRGRSMGTMIGEFWILKEAIENAGLPIQLIRSQTWQKAYGVNQDLPKAERGAAPARKLEISRDRRVMRENRMIRWADTEWPWARERFGPDWNMGTIAAALIGRHYFEVQKAKER